MNHDIHRRSVQKILKTEKLYPYKPSLLQELSEDDFERHEEFCEEVMERLIDNPNFANSIVFSDKATFHLNGRVNRHNCRFWYSENPHWIIETHTQTLQKVNVWAGISDHQIIGSFFIFENCDRYLALFQEDIVPSCNSLFPDTNLWFLTRWSTPSFSVKCAKTFERGVP